jgi:hypothetical protein
MLKHKFYLVRQWMLFLIVCHIVWLLVKHDKFTFCQKLVNKEVIRNLLRFIHW